MYLFSTAYYLATRRSLVNGISTTAINLTNNLFVFAASLLTGIASGRQFFLSLAVIAILVAAAILFSYCGNRFSLKSLATAPNPGYSLIVSKSYVVLTTIAAVVFLGSSISLKNGLAVIAIVFFQLFILIDKPGGQNKKSNFHWLYLAVAAFFCFGFLTLSSIYLFLKGVDPLVFLTYVAGVNSILFFLDAARSRGPSFHDIFAEWKILSMLGFLSTGFNFALFEALRAAPNVGYVNAINVSSISAITIISAFLFKDDLTKRKLAGIVGVTAGLIVLIM